jgi:hypothetical protein
VGASLLVILFPTVILSRSTKRQDRHSHPHGLPALEMLLGLEMVHLSLQEMRLSLQKMFLSLRGLPLNPYGIWCVLSSRLDIFVANSYQVNPVQPHYPVSEQAFNLDPELWPPPVDSSMTLADLQRLDDSSLSEMPNFVPEPFVENSFQAGGLNVAQTAPNSVRLISSSPARIPWSNNTHALPNVSYQTYSDSSWEHLSRFQPTPESYDTSTFSMVPSQQPSRDPSHSSRSPNNPTSNLTYNGTPPTALIVVEDSVLPALASGLVSEVEPQALPIEQSATKKRSKKPKAAPKAVAHSPQQSATTLSKGKRKGAMSEPGREKAKDVRRVGSCVRCRMYHLGVW